VKNEPDKEKQSESREHLKRLRDFLDLPMNALDDDVLAFVLADTHGAIVRYIDDQYLTLVCEIADLDTLRAEDWRPLLARLSAAYDPALPLSLATIEDKLAAVWTAGADVPVDQWLRFAQNALTFAVDIQMRLGSRSL
jgi:hypothetical protein